MKIYLERLYHYSCDSCKKWWTIGDIEPVLGATMICPHCRRYNCVDYIVDGQKEQEKKNADA